LTDSNTQEDGEHPAGPTRRWEPNACEEQLEMYQRTEKLTVGTGDSSGLIQRIQTDLVPLVESASGFIAYTIVKIDAQNALSTRLFRDLSSMDSETQSTSQTTGSIANDFQVTLDVIVNADVSIGVASVLTEVFQP
jgi:hypothetical protein